MPEVYVGIGANLQPRKHIHKALGLLRQDFQEIRCSPAYRNAAVGFTGPAFINLVAGFSTRLSACEVQSRLKQIEHHCGRSFTAERFASRTMDIDLLLYGEQILQQEGIEIPRQEILQQAYVLRPLSDLIPLGVFPGTELCFMVLWQQLEQCTQPWLEPVALD